MLGPCGPGGGTEPNSGDREPERAVTSATKVAALGPSSTTSTPSNLLPEDEEVLRKRETQSLGWE